MAYNRVDIRRQDEKYVSTLVRLPFMVINLNFNLQGTFSQNDKEKQLVKVQWSPSGDYLGVAEDGNVFVWRMNEGKVRTKNI